LYRAPLTGPAEKAAAREVFVPLGWYGRMTGRNLPQKPAPRGGRDSLAAAQDLIYQAWEIPNPKKRVALARKALAISPDYADAYVLLAQAVTAPAKVLELYRKGVAAGQLALGQKAFERDRGHFWGLLETRPYMRARAGLVQSLWDCGQYDEALSHWRDMLMLNLNDNQGIRYVLAARLLESGRDRELGALLKKHADDARAYILWIRALFAFRTEGDNAKSRRALTEALESNPHVPCYLLGHKPLPRALPKYTGLGDEREAVCVAAENIKAWQTTSGALAWLAERINPEKPTILH
jgi:tetratricopeptide (TPR) repeat protein